MKQTQLLVTYVCLFSMSSLFQNRDLQQSLVSVALALTRKTTQTHGTHIYQPPVCHSLVSVLAHQHSAQHYTPPGPARDAT